MPCPFLTRLSSSYVRNYGQTLLKTYGQYCPVVSATMCTEASPNPAKIEGKNPLFLIFSKPGRNKLFLCCVILIIYNFNELLLLGQEQLKALIIIHNEYYIFYSNKNTRNNLDRVM